MSLDCSRECCEHFSDNNPHFVEHAGLLDAIHLWPNWSRCVDVFGKRDRSTGESVYGECTVNIATRTARPITCSRKRRKATPTIVRTPSSVRRTESGRPRVSIPQTQLQ